MINQMTVRLQILLIAVISTAWGQAKNAERPVRAPQGQVKYDIDGEYEALYFMFHVNAIEIASGKPWPGYIAINRLLPLLS